MMTAHFCQYILILGLESPFEIVWLPLVDCKDLNQCLFCLKIQNFLKFNKISFKNNNEIFNKLKNIKFINIKYGQVLIFSQNLHMGI